MNKKLTGLVAGAAGGALLLSGATYALWSDDGTVDGGTITSGNLDVAVLDGQWTDESADRSDQGHAIDLTDFRIVPGDTIQGSFGVDVGLEGDNMLAELALSGGDLSDDLAEGLSLEYVVRDSSGAEVASSSGAADGVTVALASQDNENSDTVADVPATVDDSAEFTLDVAVTFDEDTSEQELTQTQAALADAGVSLTQVRSGEGFN